MFKHLPKISPSSLYARFLLITVIPMLLMMIAATYAFYDRHWEEVQRNMEQSLAGEIALVVREYERVALSHHIYREENRAELFLAAGNYMGMGLEVISASQVDNTRQTDREYDSFARELGRYITDPFVIYHEGEDNITMHITLRSLHEIESRIEQGALLQTLIITLPYHRLAHPTTHLFVMWMTGMGALLLIISVLFLKNQVRSIVRLTKAAQSFGRGQDMPDFKPQGAREIRLAAIAFIEMRQRIKRLIERRTQMLAGVSHDLRTPLTRMRLQLAMLEKSRDIDAREIMQTELREKFLKSRADHARAVHELQQDISQMEKMLGGYLEFARSDAIYPNDIAGDAKDMDVRESNFVLYDMLRSAINGLSHHGKKVECAVPPDIRISGNETALRRCINNLVENSLRYGASFVSIEAEYSVEDDEDTQQTLRIIIDDNGQGIPADKREEVFQPFYRIEQSRNPETGGIGLGLPVTRDIIHRHGGDITLDDSPLGGLRVVIILPI